MGMFGNFAALATALLFLALVDGVCGAAVVVDNPLGGSSMIAHCSELNSSEVTSYKIVTVEFAEVSAHMIIMIWLVIAGLARVGFHFTPLNKYLPESCLLIVIGFVIGGIYLATQNTAFIAELNSQLFFLVLLPPIMLEAGYFMPQTAFWNNIGSILMFAVLGTLFNAFTIGLSLWGLSGTGIFGANTSISFLECMTFSSLISAVDPVAVLAVFEEVHVNQVLHILVFGESLLNDAVTVVLYRVFESFSEIGADNLAGLDIAFGIISFFVVAFGGVLVGITVGIITAFITKYTYKVRVIEPMIVFTMAYLSYLVAEMLTLSSILSIVACSMFMKPYVEQNISRKSHTTIKYFLKMLSSIMETIIFIFLGTTSLEEKNMHEWNTWFVVFTLIFCFVYRSIGVVIQVKILNFFRLFKINRRSQFIMAYGGIRGGIAFSLVALLCPAIFPSKNVFFTTTVVVIMFTVFLQGITIRPLVGLLHVKKEEKRKRTMNEELYKKFNGHLMCGIEDIIGHNGHYSVREKWKTFNDKYLERLLVREQKVTRNQKIIDVYCNLSRKDAFELVKEGKSIISAASSGNLSNITSSFGGSVGGEDNRGFEDESSLDTVEVAVETSVVHRCDGEEIRNTDEDDIENPSIPREGSGSATGPESSVRLRRSSMQRDQSISAQLDALDTHAIKPYRSSTIPMTRYQVAEDVTGEEPTRIDVGRSLRILAHHRIKSNKKKARQANHKQEKGGRKSSSASVGFLSKIKKIRSGNSLAMMEKHNCNGEVPKMEGVSRMPSTIDEEQPITFSVNAPTAQNGSAETEQTKGRTTKETTLCIEEEMVHPNVTFTIQDEETADGEGETKF